MDLDIQKMYYLSTGGDKRALSSSCAETHKTEDPTNS